MALVNFTGREITCKLVYCGPGRSGKTTNLQYIHGRVPDTRRGRIVSLATHGDRTLFFDFLVEADIDSLVPYPLTPEGITDKEQRAKNHTKAVTILNSVLLPAMKEVGDKFGADEFDPAICASVG